MMMTYSTGYSLYIATKKGDN